MREPKVHGFGIDLAGYSTGASRFAAAVTDGADSALVYLLDTPFNDRLESSDSVDDQFARERDFMLRCLRLGPLAVDVPIDLQDLGSWRAIWLWQLTKRPVDYAFRALSPLADRLGSVVARFQALLEFAPELRTYVGRSIFETYPAASLQLDLPKITYKGGSARRSGNRWLPTEDGKAHDGVASLCHRLMMFADSGTELDCDDVDAIICALTAVASDDSLLQGHELNREVRERIRKVPGSDNKREFTAPQGYLLLSAWPWKRLTIGYSTPDDFFCRYGVEA